MSEEEIIKEFIEDYNASYPEEEEWVVIYPNQVQAIQGLLDLYNKEKEKNNNLLLQLKDSEKELLEVTNNVISKDKIKAKIKELEDNMILFTNDKEKFNRYKYTRDTLEKLLGE